jgi:hypothetical protein
MDVDNAVAVEAPEAPAQDISSSSSIPSIPQSNTTLDKEAPEAPASESVNVTTSNPVRMEVDNPVAVKAPGWLSAVKMDVYLQDCSEAEAWQTLVKTLYKFEEGNAIYGVCHLTGFIVFLSNSIRIPSA